MYKVNFKLVGEIAMGSPYNGGRVEIKGDYIPEIDLSKRLFQDIYLLSPDGSILYLIEWKHIRPPTFIIWRINANDKSCQSSKRFFGCCESLELCESNVKVKRYFYDKEKDESGIVEEVVESFFDIEFHND